MFQRQFSGLTVVVIDDNSDVRTALGNYLSSSGAVVGMCQNFEAALLLIPRLQPNLVVSEIAMPGKDGFALLREIRTLDPSSGGTAPIIALAEVGSGYTGHKLYDAGFAAVLRKPFTPRDLVKAIAGLGLLS